MITITVLQYTAKFPDHRNHEVNKKVHKNIYLNNLFAYIKFYISVCCAVFCDTTSYLYFFHIYN